MRFTPLLLPLVLALCGSALQAQVGVEKQRGTIAAGMAADIIAAPGDPLADPGVLGQVQFVMEDGKVVKGKSAAPRTAAR